MSGFVFPQGWCSARLADLVLGPKSITYGVLKPGPFAPEGRVLLRVKDVVAGVVDDTDAYRITEQLHRQFQKSELRGGEVVLSIQGTVGRVARIPKHLEGANISRTLAVLRPAYEEGTSWIWAMLQTPQVGSTLRGCITGSTRDSLNLEDLRDVAIPVPPLNEQRRIVAKIEELFSKLDAGVAALERVRAGLKRYRAAVLKAAVDGKLTEDWRAQHPDTEPASVLLERILTERRRKWEVDQRVESEREGSGLPKGWLGRYRTPEGVRDPELPPLPDRWAWATVDQLADVGTGTTPLRSKKEYFQEGSIPWVTSTAVNQPVVRSASEFVTERALKATTLRIYPAQTLIVALYVEGKTRGKVSELAIDATINQALAALVMVGVSSSCRAYLKSHLAANYEKLRRQAAGGMQPNLNLGLVRSIVVALPPLAEQVQIVAEVERRLSIVDEIETQVESNLKRAARLRQGILKRAFEGDLVPQDPTDEPAEQLLDRIRHDRQSSNSSENGKPAARRRGPRRKTIAAPSLFPKNDGIDERDES
ncbi:restriction endonuclease subunit S [Paludisphaera soli]|uniref:restriction endonuclease subunit S n=1 Tax=Paludisphaera soli TaxID=2712865 RepID=UPI0028F45C9E|nr:restriction endonuclease subunit S [Paludisphaera soli]